MPDTELTRHELDDLYGATLVEAFAAEVTVLSGPQGDGVIDDDVYRRLATDIRGNDGTVVADLSGSRLDAVLAGGVDVLKVSEEELERDGRIERDGSVGAAMEALARSGAANVVVTHGDERATALIDGELVRISAPELEPVENAGRRRLADRSLGGGAGTGRVAPRRAPPRRRRGRAQRDASRPRQRDPRADRTPGEPRRGQAARHTAGPMSARIRR